MFRAMVKKWGESDDLEKISITAVGDAPSPKIEIRGLFAEDAEGKSFEVMMSRSTLRFGGLGNPLLSFITAKDCKGKGKVVYEPVGEQHIGECGDYVNEFHFDIDSDDDPQITTPVVIRIIVALENVLPAGAGEDQGRTPVNVFQMRVLKGERK